MGANEALSGDFEYSSSVVELEKASPSIETSEKTEMEDLKYGYCTEFLINNIYPHIDKYDIERLRLRLSGFE